MTTRRKDRWRAHARRAAFVKKTRDEKKNRCNNYKLYCHFPWEIFPFYLLYSISQYRCCANHIGNAFDGVCKRVPPAHCRLHFLLLLLLSVRHRLTPCCCLYFSRIFFFFLHFISTRSAEMRIAKILIYNLHCSAERLPISSSTISPPLSVSPTGNQPNLFNICVAFLQICLDEPIGKKFEYRFIMENQPALCALQTLVASKRHATCICTSIILLAHAEDRKYQQQHIHRRTT